MVLNAKDKEMLLRALDTEFQRIKRAINAERSAAIKQILTDDAHAFVVLQEKIRAEVAK